MARSLDGRARWPSYFGDSTDPDGPIFLASGAGYRPPPYGTHRLTGFRLDLVCLNIDCSLARRTVYCTSFSHLASSDLHPASSPLPPNGSSGFFMIVTNTLTFDWGKGKCWKVLCLWAMHLLARSLNILKSCLGLPIECVVQTFSVLWYLCVPRLFVWWRDESERSDKGTSVDTLHVLKRERRREKLTHILHTYIMHTWPEITFRKSWIKVWERIIR